MTGFRDYAWQSLGNVYPAVAKLVPTVAEELEFFVRAAVTCCGAASSVRATTSLASN